jgi:hypothetical protein
MYTISEARKQYDEYCVNHANNNLCTWQNAFSMHYIHQILIHHLSIGGWFKRMELIELVKKCHIMTQRCFMLCTTFDPSFVHWRLGVYHHFQKYFSYYFCGGNWSTQRNPDLSQVTDKLYHIMFYRVHLAMNGVQNLSIPKINFNTCFFV